MGGGGGESRWSRMTTFRASDGSTRRIRGEIGWNSLKTENDLPPKLKDRIYDVNKFTESQTLLASKTRFAQFAKSAAPSGTAPPRAKKICAIDCGIGREVTIDCPSDC